VQILIIVAINLVKFLQVLRLVWTLILMI